MMVIGDSLAQGCRSLSVTSAFCSQSWAARLAAENGWKFAVPNHPRPVLFDLEREIRNLNPVSASPDGIKIGGFVGRLLENLQAWERQLPDSAECFDNIAIAGTAVADLYQMTSKSCDDTVKGILQDNPLNALDTSKLADLHISINGRYVLNPSKNPKYENYSPLAWVEKRQPRNLFIQIGHNHGLFDVGFSANISDINDLEASITQPGGPYGNYWEQWGVVAKRLASLPETVERIFVFLLPKIGAVGNLMPSGSGRDAAGYAAAYNPVFSTHPRLPGTQLCGVDKAILSVNKKIEHIIRYVAKSLHRENRITFIDAYRLLQKYDYKNSADSGRRIAISNDVTVDNQYLNGDLRFGWPPIHDELSRGGFFSIDGMHPSGVGYAVLASEIMDIIGISHDRAALLKRAYAEDRLLSDYPAELDMLVGLLAILREAISVNHFDHSPVGTLSDDFHFADLLRVLKRIFIR